LKHALKKYLAALALMMAVGTAALGQAAAASPGQAPTDEGNGLLIEPEKLPDTFPQEPYDVRLYAKGDYVPVLQWRVQSGALPPGIKLAENGELRGAAERAGEFEFVVAVRDGGKPQQAVQKVFVIKVVEALKLDWKVPAHVTANRIDGSVAVSNTSPDDMDLTFDVKAVTPSDAGAYIDEFDAGVVSVDASGQSFVIQGPHGRQFTVQVNGQTEWDNNESISSLTTNSIVQISGMLDRADSTIDADEVAILSQDGFYAAGQITYVQPPSGTASSFDLYVRGLLPTTTGLSLGQIAQINLSGNEKYFIYWMHNPLTQFLFNSGALVPGQHVSVGGPASGAANPQAVMVKRIVLRHWGYNGTVVPGSVDMGNLTFQMNVTGFAGLLVPTPVTVFVAPGTHYRDGLNKLDDVSSITKVRVVGLLIKDPFSSQLVLLAHYVDDMDS